MARRKEPRIAECIAGLLFFGICLLKEYWQIVCLVIGGIIVLIIVINMCVNLNRKKQRPYNYPIYDNEIPSNYQEPLKEIDRTSNERPEKVKNHSNTHSKKSQKTPENNSYKSIEQRETYNQRKNYIGKVDIQNCTSEELLSLKDFPKEKIELFINARSSGHMWYDIDSFAKEFDLQPHEIYKLQEYLIFPNRILKQSKGGRKVDW